MNVTTFAIIIGQFQIEDSEHEPKCYAHGKRDMHP